MMERNGTENFCNRSLGWLQRPDNDAKPWIWKFSNCFSPVEHTLPSSGKTKDYMENKKPIVQLKDVPPPNLAVTNRFPAIPHPSIHLLQQQQIQLQTSPKVSCCALCSSNFSSCTREIHFGGGNLINPNTVLDSRGTGTITCQVGSGFQYQPASPFKSEPSRNHFSGTGNSFTGICLDKNVSSCQLHSPSQHVPYFEKFGLPACHGEVHKLHRVSEFQKYTSSGFFPFSEITSTSSGHLKEHVSQSELSPHVCTNSFRLNMAPSFCLNGSFFCEDCMEKPTRSSIIDSGNIWQNITPSTQSAPVPLCNGCGINENAKDGSLRLSKSLQKYGPPDTSLTGQIQENLPPIGVFWDIENCSVPSGRSAVTVVKRIREKFFKGHREAEFICVCDISKENKEVIEELNNCQVTVAHINATAKNAADDKLRQSLRRFADAHTTPATVVLVSTDVNFALELSDLRHRHGFHIILVHKNQASEALLHHAHELIKFEDFISDLPPRLPLKMPPCHTMLYVYNLPANRDGKSVTNRLRRLSDNCGGKVLSISGNTAILRFINQESAERAKKRMENEDVFGNRITVSLTPKNKELVETKNSSCAGVEKAKSPKKVKNTKLCLLNKDFSETSPNGKAPATKGLQSTPGSNTKNTSVKSLQELCQMDSKNSSRTSQNQQDRKSRMEPSMLNITTATSSLALAPKNVGTAESTCKINQRRDSIASRSATNSPVEKDEKVFQVSNPSAFSKMTGSRQLSPLSRSGWSSRSLSPSLSNRSSPLAFNIINPTNGADCLPDPFANGVDVQIGNLDYRLSRKDLQKTLQEVFSRHGKVKNVELSPHTDYQLKATVQMENLHEAISAVNNLHRYKIGSKRIQVSLATGATNKSLTLLSSETTSILQDAPACCLPLFKFTEIYEKKFGHKLIVSDMYKLPDTVAIRDQGNGRLVCLLPSSQTRQSPLGSSQSQDGSSTNCSPIVFEELEYHEPICRQHCMNKAISENEFDPDTYVIPYVVLSLKTFAPQVHSLLQTHEGTVPLLSFPDCYAAEFSILEMVPEGQGVPLEHLITCVPGVNIATAQSGIKVVKWIHNKPPPPNTDPWMLRSKSPVGNPQLIQFSREVIDLMKNQTSCIMPVSKFIPTYHHHFAKQCRVSDYGYSKLMELLEAVPHVLQILGMGSKRMLTLTHRAQVKRFTQDLLKLLKSQASKHVIVKEFVQAYHWCFSRDWDVTEYGVCELVDLVSEIPDTTICVSEQDNEMVISIPKRERTQDEIERTKQFAKEVVDLLRHQPHFRMPFNKFIPSYHHHFGRQCKLTYYGFTKLLDLFEAIPDVLQAVDTESGKQIQLINRKSLRSLTAQLLVLMMSWDEATCLTVDQLKRHYEVVHSIPLNPCEYGFLSLTELLKSLPYLVEVFTNDEVTEECVRLTTLYHFAKNVRSLLHTYHYQQIFLHEFPTAYSKYIGELLQPKSYGYNSLDDILAAIPQVVWIKGHGHKRIVVLKNDMKTRVNSSSSSPADALEEYGSEQLMDNQQLMERPLFTVSLELKQFEAASSDCSRFDQELLCLSNTSPVDLLCGPVPSCLPSPQLRPDPVLLQFADLIQFEERFPNRDEIIMEGKQDISATTELTSDPLKYNIRDNTDFSSYDFLEVQESSLGKEATESPAKKQNRNKVKLAAKFSFAPVTKL